MIEPGVYKSDVLGHLFVLKFEPLSVTCVVCIESCARANHKTQAEFAKSAAEFVNKHGALDERIASNLTELVKS
jgi:hypothetical protein